MLRQDSVSLKPGADSGGALLGNAKDTMLALHVELRDEATERLTSIGMPTGSLEWAATQVGSMATLDR